MPFLHRLLTEMPRELPIDAIIKDAVYLSKLMPPCLLKTKYMNEYRKIVSVFFLFSSRNQLFPGSETPANGRQNDSSIRPPVHVRRRNCRSGRQFLFLQADPPDVIYVYPTARMCITRVSIRLLYVQPVSISRACAQLFLRLDV